MASETPTFSLEVSKGPDAVVAGQRVRGKSFTSHLVTIGRNPNKCEFQLYDLDAQSTVSRIHCTIYYDEKLNLFMLTDENSASGTQVNNMFVDPHDAVELRDNDQVTLGNPDGDGALLIFKTNLEPSHTGNIRITIKRAGPVEKTRVFFPSSPANKLPTVTTQLHHDIFLSYDHDNLDVMKKLRTSLMARGLIVWTDEMLTPGTPSWQKAIQRAIERVPCFVVMMSPEAKESTWVEREVNYATTQQCKFFPVLVKGSAQDAIPISLISNQYIDLREDFETGVESLVTTIREFLDNR